VKVREIVAVVLVVVILAGCLGQHEVKISKMKYAKLFSIEKHDGYIVVTDSEGRKIVLWKDKKPDVKADLFVKIPVKRVIALSTIDVAYLKAVNCTDAIVGVVSAKKWYLEGIEEKIANGKIVEVGKARSPDYEKILALKPDVVFVDAKFSGSDVIKKFKSLGIPYVACDSWLERHPLGRVEWIKFFAAFFDREREAEKYFNSVENRILEIQNTVGKEKKVKVVYALVLKGRVTIPGGQSYHSKLVEIAGGDYIFKDLNSTKYVQVNAEELIARTAEADVYIAIYMGKPIKSKNDLIEEVPGLAETRPFKEDRVYAMQPWVWQRIHRIDEIVEDLAAILHPELFPQHKLTMFKKV